MTDSCKSCGTPLPDGAEFCPGCGSKVDAQGAPPAASRGPAGGFSTDEITRVVQPALSQIGRDQAIGIAGGALALISSFLPFVDPWASWERALGVTSMPGVAGIGSRAIVNGGFWGVLVPVAAIALAVGCAVQLRRPLIVAGFGLSAGALGVVLGSGALGVGLFTAGTLSSDLNFGFFLSLLGFGALVYSYTRRVLEIG